MSYLERPSWWYNQIRRRARSLWILVVSLIVVLFIALGFVVYVQIYLPDGGYIWIFTISPDFARILRLLVTLSSVIGTPVLLRRLYRKRIWTMYQEVARALINNLRDKNKISEECYKELSSIIQTHLSSCSEGGNKEGCLDGLLRASCELSNTLARSRQP
jgi:hypothetical protein